MPDNLIFFLHIPRTMGTFLKDQCLYPNFSPDRVILDLTPHGAVRAEPERFNEIDLICGHVGYNIRSVGLEPGFRLTWLRDPIHRSKSMYMFCQRVEWHYLHRQANQMDLIEFVHDGETRPIIANAQARLMGDNRPYQEIVGKTIDRNYIDACLYAAPEPTLEQALARFGEFDFVGLADRFYDSVRVLWRILDINKPKLGPDAIRQMHPYLRSRVYHLTTAKYEALDRITQIDQRIYRCANQKLDELLDYYNLRRAK